MLLPFQKFDQNAIGIAQIKSADAGKTGCTIPLDLKRHFAERPPIELVSPGKITFLPHVVKLRVACHPGGRLRFRKPTETIENADALPAKG